MEVLVDDMLSFVSLPRSDGTRYLCSIAVLLYLQRLSSHGCQYLAVAMIPRVSENVLRLESVEGDARSSRQLGLEKMCGSTDDKRAGVSLLAGLQRDQDLACEHVIEIAADSS